MSILIKGLKMPKGDEALVIVINSNGVIEEPNWQWDYTLINGAEAVEFPDHGDLIDNAPTIDAVPLKHGKWTHVGYDCGLKIYECSVCNKRCYGRMNYCPNCGHPMEMSEEDENWYTELDDPKIAERSEE